MRPLTPIPPELAGRAFSLDEARRAGLTSRMLQHPRFVEVFPRVYRHVDTVLSRPQLVAAARATLPGDSAVSHMTRFVLDGLEVGDEDLHFTIGRELHLDLDDIVLHRTVRMPPRDGHGVSHAAAFIQSASLLSPLRLIGVGDWLLHRGLLDPELVRAAAIRDPWRPGTDVALEALEWIDGRSRSLPESEVRVLMRAAGLEVPEPNGVIDLGDTEVLGDLVLRQWRVVVEYEGRQHAESTQQFNRDIERYRQLRANEWEYVQVTARRLASPRALMTLIHGVVRDRGYDGPSPHFGATWEWVLGQPAPLGPPRKGARSTLRALSTVEYTPPRG